VDFLLGGLLLFILLQGLAGVIDGIRYYRYIRECLRAPVKAWTPFASVVLPCKGLDYELEQNVEALLRQEYPDYEVIFVTASDNDPSVSLLHSLAASAPERKVKFVTAGVSDQRGEKVNNLIQAIGQAAGESVVYVFTDSDSLGQIGELVSPQ
jgi:cellulose synthase/poly-beta-1,6-N-acetylglucosamine synthase-like glycosyltransferase